jgi:hypothetical protein
MAAILPSGYGEPTGTIGGVVSVVLVSPAAASCPEGTRIGVGAGVFLALPVPPFSAFMMLLGGQLKSVGGHTVFSSADEEPKSLSGLPICVTSLVLLLLLLLSA